MNKKVDPSKTIADNRSMRGRFNEGNKFVLLTVGIGVSMWNQDSKYFQVLHLTGWSGTEYKKDSTEFGGKYSRM